MTIFGGSLPLTLPLGQRYLPYMVGMDRDLPYMVGVDCDLPYMVSMCRDLPYMVGVGGAGDCEADGAVAG